MFKHFLWLIGAVLLATACNSYDVEGQPEITATPPRWSVDYILRPADLKDSEKTWQEFVISNKAETGELQIFSINLLTPEGRLIDDPGIDEDISKLFSFEYSNVANGGNGGITKVQVDGSNNPVLDAEGNYQIEGYTPVLADNDAPAFSFDNFSNATNTFRIAPICPIKDPLHPTAYSYAKNNENAASCHAVPGDPTKCLNECQSGYGAGDYNRFIKVKVNYKQLEAALYKAMLERDIKDEGNFAVEFCTNDPNKDTTGTTCAEGTSFKVPIYRFPNLPPKPYVGLRYTLPISGYKDHRVIQDPVNMDVSLTCPGKEDADATTCNKIIFDPKSGEDQPDGTIKADDFRAACCAEDWQEFYCLKYRWELIETPTPLAVETRISLDNIIDGGEGSWYSACSYDDPTLASFKGYMITPTPDGTYYTVKISAVTVDKQTQLESDITDKIDRPNIIPRARVMVQLTWKEGLRTPAELDRQEGVAVDLDLHFVKKGGMDSCGNSAGADGLLCTSMTTPTLAGSSTHDDCHFNDLGCNGKFGDCNICTGGSPTSNFQTIAWHATLDLDNTWGGADFTSPETINLGPIEDANGDGFPDVTPYSDDYLVIVNYNRCQNLKDDDQSACQSGGADHAVHAKVEIFVDGEKAPRPEETAGGTTRPADDSLARSLEFIIHPQEWIVLDLVTWDQALMTGKWPGDAVVKNMPTYLENVCKFDLAFCHGTPIWGDGVFQAWVTDPVNTGDGSCYPYTGQ